MIKKTAQIFMFDLIFSSIVLVVTLGVIFSYVVGTTSNEEIYSLGLQITDSFTQTKLNALNDERVRDMFKDPTIRNLINIENTVAQQAVQFEYLGRRDLAKNLTKIFIESYVKGEFGYNLTLEKNNEVITLFSQKGIDFPSFEESRISSRIQRSVLGYINRTDLYEGYIVRLDIWA